VEVKWKCGQGRVVGRLRRKLNLDISRYSHFMMRCNLIDTCRLTVRTVTDGTSRVTIDAVPGRNVFHECEGPLPGNCLQELEIEIRALPDGPGKATLFWLGLFDHDRRNRMRALPSPYDGRWEGLILPEKAVKQFTPQLNLFFDQAELTALRRKVAKPYYRQVMNDLRRQARLAIHHQPHKQVGEYPITPGSGQRYDRTYAMSLPMNERIGPEMFICAFVGLLDQDYRLLRTALSSAMAAAHCAYWDDSFMQTIPGGCWDHRAFKAFALTEWFVKAWDWAGSLLTPAGSALMARTVSLKSLPLHQMSLEKYGYMRHNNQAIIFATGAILGHSALARVWDYGAERLDVAIAALSETVRNYTEPDGGAHEGLSYFNWSYTTALEGYGVAARVKGIPVRKIVPPCVLKTPHYLKNIMSTVKPVGTGINVADGGKPGRANVMGMLGPLLTLTDDPEIQSLWAAACNARDPRRATGGIPDLLYGPARLPKAQAEPPVFSLLKQTGMLCSCRPTRRGPVRLQVIGAKAGAGHTHADKGSFVLEAFGEEILIDRGICFYGDARAGSMQRADQHNMITPNDAEGNPLVAVCPCPSAIIPSGKGNCQSLRVRIDGTAQWAPVLRQWVRMIASPDPGVFTVTDLIARKRKGSISFHLHSRFPWEWGGQGWITKGRKGSATVMPDWQSAKAHSGEDGVEGSLKPVYHLTLTSPAGREFELSTRIQVRAL
jgi:hypothetical protein